MYASIHSIFLRFDDRVEIFISIVGAHRAPPFVRLRRRRVCALA
jgi:hypothetical protein